MVNLFCLCGGDEQIVIESQPPLEASIEEDHIIDETISSTVENSLYEHYKKKWTTFGDKTALVYPVTGEELTYSELLDSVTHLAGALASMGVSAQQRVALHADNSIQTFLACLAVEFLNATVVICKTTLTVRELVYQCSNSDVELIITDEPCHSVALQALDQLPMVRKVVVANMASPAQDLRIAATIEDLIKRGAQFEDPEPMDPNEAEVIITFTSGTTGLPKGAVHTQAGLLAQFQMTGPSGSNIVDHEDVILQWGPISHVSGNILLHIALSLGNTIVVANVKKDLPNAAKLFDAYNITGVALMPAILRALIDLLKAYPGCFNSLKKVFVGGSVINISWSEEFMSLLDLDTYRIVFGMSECLLTLATPEHEKWVTSIGYPMKGVQVKIVDADRNDLGPNESGEIAIKSPTNMKCYDKNPEATSGVFHDGWLLTGDCGYMDEQGLVFILERLKELIKCMDNQVTPAELEDYISAHRDDIREVAVIGLPNDEVGEAPTAFIVLREGVEASDEIRQEIIDLIKSQFAVYKHLYGGVFFVNQLPKTDSGKFAKVELRKQIIAGTYEFV